MYSLFTKDPGWASGSFKFAEWDYLRDGFRRNLNVIFDYYRNAVHSVKSDHLLVSLLTSISVPRTMPLDRYFANVEPLAFSVTAPFQLTTPIHSGKLFNGVFYGAGVKEILIVSDETFDVEKATREWESLSPVRVLRHPFTDLALNIPDGIKKTTETGYAVISINLTMLAIQYRAFLFAEDARKTGEGERRNVMQFIYMYVLPNMLPTHLDQAIFNRINHLHQGREPVYVRPRHPFMLTDFSSRADNIQSRILKTLAASGYSFNGTMASIPGAVTENMTKAMLIPEVAPTRQILWALVFARLHVILFLVTTAERGTKQRDQMEVSAIGDTLLRLRRQRVFESTLPDEMYRDTMVVLDKIVEITKTPKHV